MARKAAERAYEDLHEKRPWHDGTFTVWTSERTQSTPFHYLDGVGIYVAPIDVNPGDNFLEAPEPHAD